MCFFAVFGESCRKYHGPHDDACLNFLWDRYGCLSDGEQYFSKLNPQIYNDLINQNIR